MLRHAFYLTTFAEHGNSPALTIEFFQYLANTLPQQWVVFLACRDNQPIAGALCLRGDDTLYGHYWGAREHVNGLHFEPCYHQGIEYCLREGLHRFEPGAQGAHKLARGFLPVLAHSLHLVFEPAFQKPLQHWCEEERAATLQYLRAAMTHAPFRHPAA